MQTTATARGDKVMQPVASHNQLRQSSSGIEVPERPVLAPNVRLTGQMQETGFTEQQWLIERDGKFIQVSELLYRIAERANGERTLEEIAAGVTEVTDWIVSADQVQHIFAIKLIPLGLVEAANGSVVSRTQDQRRSALAVNLRMRMLGPRICDPIPQVLQFLYTPLVLIPVLIAIVAAHGWLYFTHGLAGSIRAALFMPGALLVLLVIMLIAAIFHELGHAAALRYGGGKVRVIGVGLYLIMPVFYTDATDMYRLGHWARVRTDLGGIYFDLVFALGMIALYWVSGQELLLFTVLLMNLDIIYQFLPFVRFDGYWALADLTGIPDFFSQMGPFLRSLLPAVKGTKLPPVKRWVKLVFASYIILTIPVLVLLFFLVVKGVPHLISMTWDALFYQTEVFSGAWSSNDILLLARVVTQMLLLALPLLGTAYALYSMSQQLIRALWNWSKPTPMRRVAGTLVAMGAVTFVALLWAPALPFISRSIPTGPAGTQSFEVTERNHVQVPVSYPQSPPVGGNHAPIVQNCGFYDTPIANENAVHSLEHGAVWITYQPDLSKEQVDSLRQLAHRQSYVLVSPYPRLSTPVVASAWGHQLHLDSADDPRLDQFLNTFRLGPQAPEREEPCTGGVGTPK